MIRNLFNIGRRSVSFGRGQKFPTKEFKYHRIEGNPIPAETLLTKPDALKFYKQMTGVRLLENESGRLYMEKAIKGFCHLYSGQEACCVGMEAAIRRDDSVITAYRCHGWAYVRGASIESILCELTGRMTGCSKGKGGSMHIYAHGFYGGNGIVGAQVPMGAGIALAHKLQKNGLISLTLYGDGAANQGQVFEAYNMAALWKLPTVFICENNQYGMGTSCERAAACTKYYTRGDFIPGIWIDGSCVLSVREGMKYCHDWVTSGKGPIVVELHTYRYSGHSMSDPGTSYRTADDVQAVRKSRDPIVNFSDMITSSGLVTQAELDEIKDKLQDEVDKAREKALSDPFPDPQEIGHYVFCGGTHEGYVRGNTPFVRYDSSK